MDFSSNIAIEGQALDVRGDEKSILNKIYQR